MNNLNVVSPISGLLIKWYEKNKRDLPWRDILDPYKIWISEIILQQTRVNQGLNYYLRFIDRFPTISSLAQAHEDDVLKYWQGLGYYSRARNLHKAACQVMTNFDGVFPIEYSHVISLSGIGEYTAAAICSFAYNQPYAVVDGNVYRVLSRLFGIEKPIDSGVGKKEFAELAKNVLSVNEPGVHNQAIMEFGALQCVPVAPNCGICPFNATCIAYKLNIVSQLPIKSKKAKVTNRYFNYLFIENQDHTYLQKRVAKDIWQNLYEFPLIETDKLLTLPELINNENFKSLFKDLNEVEIIKISNPMKHVLSHRVIFAQFITLRVSKTNQELEKFMSVSLKKIDKHAVSRLMELFLERSNK